MAKPLIFYLSNNAPSLAATFSVLLTKPEYKLVDCKGANAAAINALIVAEVENKSDYDSIYVCFDISTFGTSNLAELDTIITGTTINEGSVQANASATAIVLASTASSADDTYNNKFVKAVVDESTTHFRLITDYTGSSRSCAVATTTVAVTEPSTYVVYSQPSVKYLGSGAFETEAWWKLVYSGINVPDLMYWLKGSTAYRASSTGVGTYTASTVTNSHTASKYNATTDDHFVLGLHTAATSGANQIKKIASNTATVISLSESFDPTPSGNLAFYIDRPRNMFSDLYFGYSIPTYLSKTTSIGEWSLLLDMYNDLGDADCKQTYYDEATYDKYRLLGKTIFDAVKAGIVS